MRVPPGLDVRRYQREAVDAWLYKSRSRDVQDGYRNREDQDRIVAANSLRYGVARGANNRGHLDRCPLTHLVDQCG